MLFSYWLIILIALLLPLYYFLSRAWQNAFLILASYAFYCFWDYRFLPLIVATTVVNHFFSLRIRSSPDEAGKKLFLVIALVFNLGLLGFFKYCNFFITSFVSASQSLGISADVHTLSLILPLGISFFTFKIMGYLMDVHRGAQEPADIMSFSLFVCYFPELTAGPIGRAHAFMPRIAEKRAFSTDMAFAGAQLILLGFVKKIAIADALAPYVNNVFSNTASFGSIDLLCGMYLYTLQIYADFSGYTDMVRGISKLFGIDIMENFRQPYLSRSISEFWRRWHISLSTWFRDYLYIPLGGNRKGSARTYVNLLATMLFCGLWHGASWVFVAWGGIHGLYLAVHRLFRDSMGKKGGDGEAQSIIGSVVSMILTFHAVAFAWIFFRSPDFSTASGYILSMANVSQTLSVSTPLIFITLFYMAFVLIIDLPSFLGKSELLVTDRTPWYWQGVIYALLILFIAFIGESNVQPFIYFQF